MNSKYQLNDNGLENVSGGVNTNAANRSVSAVGAEDAKVCPKCGKKTMIFYPMLGIWECLSCGHRE